MDLAVAFGRQIIGHDDPEQRAKWVVLDPPTGSGKTQGMIVYCSMMANVPPQGHPGVLIVTRLIEDAHSIAGEINKLSGKPDYAVSHHSGKALSETRDTLSNYPVLVITHSAYTAALSGLHDEHSFTQTWPFFYEWQGAGRRLVVVDEAPKLAEHWQIGLDGLRQTFASMPQTFRDEHTADTKIIADLVSIMEAEASGGKCSESILPRYRSDEGGRVDLTILGNAMRQIRFDEQLGCGDPMDNQSLFANHHERLKAIQNVLLDEMYYARVRGQHTLNSSKPVVPVGVKGAIILDATASVNVMYELFDMATISPMPTGIRSYKNVTIYVNRGQNVGKDYLRKNTDRVLNPVIENLNSRLADRNVFIATHKAIKQKVLAVKTTFKRDVGTWGAIDGSNAWKDCDTAVILGLPSMPDSWSANVYFALQGMQDTNWLHTKTRPFGKHKDIRSALKTGQTTAEVIQAINRIRCRQVNDGEGNCPDSEVYLLLPEGAVGDNILKGITGSMEGVIVKNWLVEGFEPKTINRGRPSGTGKAFQPLLQALLDMLPGTMTTSDLTEATNASSSTLKRFIAAFTKETITAAPRLKALGISYVVDGKGRSAKSYFVKT